MSRSLIISGIPLNVREYVKFDNHGCIDRTAITEGLSHTNSENYKALATIVNSEQQVTVQYSNELKWKNYDDTIQKYNLSTDQGLMGFTATPTSDDGQFRSVDPSAVEITINNNPQIPFEQKIKKTAHELYIHALFFILGKDCTHFKTLPDGTQVLNKEVNDKVIPVENEALQNYNGSGK